MNGTLTTGSTTVTGLSSTSTLFVGEYVTGSGLPAGTQVASIIDSKTITLSAAATATGGKPFTFDTVTLAGYRIINGAVDLNRDGTISNADSTSTLASHPQFAGFNVIGGKVDMNGNGKIDGTDTGDTNVDAICTSPTIINAQATGSLSGFVYLDRNQDGIIDTANGDGGIAGVTIELIGVNDLGQTVDLITTTDSTGAYSFTGLRPGTYSLGETQPAGYTDGADYLGSLGGTPQDDQFFNIVLGAGQSGVNYNYTELFTE
jgi:hypothetical protein